MLHVEDAEEGAGYGVSSRGQPGSGRDQRQRHTLRLQGAVNQTHRWSLHLQGGGIGRPLRGLPGITYWPLKPRGTPVLLAEWGVGQYFCGGPAMSCGS